MACLSMALATGLFAPSNVYAADQPAPDNATIPPAETSTASPAGELGAAAKAQSTPLEQTVETFITSEEIDTDKAVDFPTNI